MTPDSISDRVLHAWERGAGRPPAVRAALALEIIAQSEPPAALFARDDALLRLRIALLGAHLETVVRCPGCEAEFDLPLDLSALASPPPEAVTVIVEAGGFVATVRPPTHQDANEIPRNLPPAAVADALFLRCVDSATLNGSPVAPSALPASIRTEAAAALSARGMESPAADLTCGECGHRWRSPIDIAAALCRDIDNWALRLLDDVHRIASVYHWHERDIIALSPARRRFYLDAIG